MLELSHDVTICVSLIQYQYLIFEYHNYRDIEPVVVLPIDLQTIDLLIYQLLVSAMIEVMKQNKKAFPQGGKTNRRCSHQHKCF